MKTFIESVENKIQSQSHISLAAAKTEISSTDSGFYWIYTKLPLERFMESSPPSNPVHINFSATAKIHRSLKSVIMQHDSEHWCIYNGKGKQLKNRLVAEFTNTQGKTGKLALLRCFNENDFAVKYITCQSDNDLSGISEKYSDVEKDLERVWRLNYGWPFLCRT